MTVCPVTSGLIIKPFVVEYPMASAAGATSRLLCYERCESTSAVRSHCRQMNNDPSLGLAMAMTIWISALHPP